MSASTWKRSTLEFRKYRQTCIPFTSIFHILAVAFALIIIFFAFLTSEAILSYTSTSLSSRPSVAFRHASIDRKPSVIEIGPPLSFVLLNFSIPEANITAPLKVTISAAIPVPRESSVVFIVYDSLSFIRPVPDPNFSLPPTFYCSFPNTTETTALTSFRRSTSLPYKSTSIWRCPFPAATSATTSATTSPSSPPSVTIHGPSINVIGNTTLRLLPQPHALKAPVASCMQVAYNISQNTPSLMRYFTHYRSLGVTGFALYIEDRGIAGERIAAEHLATLPGVSVFVLDSRIRDYALPALPQNPTGPKIAEIQAFNLNDCLWRARYGAQFTLVQVDQDEMLLGTKNLVDELAKIPSQAAGVYVKHRLARWPAVPMVKEGLVYSKASHGFPPTWGKSIVRPERVDVQWVHHPTSFTGDTVVMDWLRFVHFSKSHYKKYNGSNWERWESYEEAQAKDDAREKSGQKNVYRTFKVGGS